MIGPGWRTIARGHAPGSAAEEVAEILQQAREARWAGLPRHTGSGRVLTARRLQLTYNPVPPPLTPFVPTPVVRSLHVELAAVCGPQPWLNGQNWLLNLEYHRVSHDEGTLLKFASMQP